MIKEQATVNIESKMVEIYLCSHDCDTYGSEVNVNFEVKDDLNDTVKYLFVSCDTEKEAKAIFDYAVNNPDKFYLEPYINTVGKYKGEKSWFDGLKAKNYNDIRDIIHSFRN